MALQLGRMFSDGIRRVLTRTGGILLVGLLVIQLLVQVSINTAVVGFVPPEAAGELGETIELTLPVSGTVGTALFLATLALSSVYFVGLSRALARPLPELSTFPASLFTRRIGRATLSMIVGGAVVMVSVTVGLMLFVLPGVFLAVCFLFFIFAVGVEDRGFIDALKRSWGLSQGNRLKLTLVVILSGVTGAVTGTVGTVLDPAGTPVVADLVTNTISSVLFVFLYGVMAAAYLQVRDDDGERLRRVDDVPVDEQHRRRSMNTSDGVRPGFVPRTWRYALVGGIVSMPLTVGLYWYTGMGNNFSLNMVTVGGFVAGSLAKRDAAAAKPAGTRAGLVGALPGLGWFLLGIVERGDALSSQFAVVSVVFVGVAVVCIGAVAGYLGGAVGGWTVEKIRQQSPAGGA